MGEGLSSQAEPVSRKPKNKGWLALGIAGLLAGTPASADAQDFDGRQFARGLLDGFVQGQRRSRQADECVQDRLPYAEMNIEEAESRANFAIEEANIRAAREIEALKERTDLTSEEVRNEQRQIDMERRREVSQANESVRRVRVDAQRQIDSCRPRW